jgi:hypothetical protein
MKTLLVMTLVMTLNVSFAEENQSAGDCLETMANKERSSENEKASLSSEGKKEEAKASDVVKQ